MTKSAKDAKQAMFHWPCKWWSWFTSSIYNEEARRPWRSKEVKIQDQYNTMEGIFTSICYVLLINEWYVAMFVYFVFTTCKYARV